MSSEISREDIDLERGDEDVAFIHTSLDMEEISEQENSREKLLERMDDRGLEVENARVIGIFRDEFSLLLKENAKIRLGDEQIYPEG